MCIHQQNHFSDQTNKTDRIETHSSLFGGTFFLQPDRPCFFFQSLGEKNKKQKFVTQNPGDTMGVSGFGSFFCLWAVRTRSNRWRTLIGSWVTLPTTGSIEIKLGGAKNITIDHGSGGADCGRRRSWPLPPPRKMCVRYTAHRKRGLVAASKRMQAEGMTMGTAAS